MTPLLIVYIQDEKFSVAGEQLPTETLELIAAMALDSVISRGGSITNIMRNYIDVRDSPSTVSEIPKPMVIAAKGIG